MKAHGTRALRSVQRSILAGIITVGLAFSATRDWKKTQSAYNDCMEHD